MMETQLAEFQQRSKYFTPLEMLIQATSNSGELLALSNSRNQYREAPLGVVQENGWADFLIYDGNPLEDISLVVNHRDHLKLVVKNGEIYKNEL